MNTQVSTRYLSQENAPAQKSQLAAQPKNTGPRSFGRDITNVSNLDNQQRGKGGKSGKTSKVSSKETVTLHDVTTKSLSALAPSNLPPVEYATKLRKNSREKTKKKVKEIADILSTPVTNVPGFLSGPLMSEFDQDELMNSVRKVSLSIDDEWDRPSSYSTPLDSFSTDEFDSSIPSFGADLDFEIQF
eukprot:TRINITY_DN14905_c0_g1_i1.p1 TRINITY_DN14905_c0_g1~~TRINITY_DN14905_c0_g1_i1.p1  ORF type:complete len:188 (+),score=48.39 TRINITY_DN14905_c0_g1_i1:195-758(+)